MDAEDVMLEEDLELEDGSDDGEVDEEYITDPPSAQASSGHASPPTSYTSSPPVLGEEPPSPRVPFSVSQHLHFTGKPAGHIRRRPGRPRKESSGIVAKEQQKSMKRYRTGARGISKRPRFSREERGELIANLESFSVPQSPGEDSNALDPETGALVPYDKTERVMPAPEDLPSFNEKWPGKLCSLCNLSERSQLGQGELLRYQCPEGGFTIVKKEVTENDESSGVLSLVGSGGDKSPRTGIGPQLSNRRQKNLNKCKNPSINSEYTDELEKIGYSDIIEPSSLLESSGHFYIHSSCAMWSIGAEKSEDEIVEHIRPIIVQSMTRKCFHCNHYGASLTCKMSCPKYFHFPCAAASGGFQDDQTYSTFCKEHLGQVPLVCSEDVHCRMCNALGDVGNLMMCSACGDHYHGACAGVAQLPGVRAGWQCKICRWCQICRMPGDEGKSLFCEQCDKLYHPQCLRPQLASIPKYGWKCKCCRMCSDCGSRTPGAGLSSRWHAHFTVCDSCYQQRNKGFCCPLCHRAYRAAAYREMVQCHTCKKFVHGTCDSGADLTNYQQRKDVSPDYEYICPICKSIAQASIKRNSIEDDLSATDPLSIEEVDDSTMDKVDYGLGKGKPYLAGKIAKKRLGITAGTAGRPKGSGKGFPGKFGYQKRQKMTEFGRKRGPKGKMRGIFGVPGLGLQRPVADANFPKSEDEPGVENRLVLCSAKDKFVLTQDICVMCGSLGTDQEGCLISCAQCGQCYHPYCVNVKVTKVILTKGWRCLDCTVCEGCGFRNDESRLILCDDCDISYHIYCMDPPLDFVPHGNWKCKWCAICQVCGTNDPGFNCSWMNSYTECGPCSSFNNCGSCHDTYNDGELIIQCSQCERWLHCSCDSIKTEAEAERCVSEGYACNMCRPRDVPPPHLVPLPPPPKIVEIVKSPEVPKVSMGSQFFMDGVCLSASGMQQMRSLTIEQTASRKKRKPKLPLALPVPQDKEANILATIESVVAGGSLDNSLEDSRIDDKEDPSEIYRDGMVWNPKGGNTGPPEGFTIYTTEAGLMILRRKRQRNLQKLGIGGFNVRMRGIRREKDEDDSSVPPTPGPLTPNVQFPDPSATTSNTQPHTAEFEKPKRKPVRRKPKSKLMECYPSYLQEAFFGRDLLDTTKVKDVESSSSEEEVASVSADKTITLSHDELKVIEAMREKKMEKVSKPDPQQSNNQTTQIVKDEKPQVIKQEARDDGDISDTDTLKDVLGLPNDLLDNDLVNRIMNEDDDLTKTSVIDELPDPALQDASSLNETNDQKDDLGDILGQHFNIESMVRDSLPNMDSKDVEEIFKGVLTDESQESQESSIFPISSSGSSYVPHSSAPSTVQSVQQAPSIVTKALPSPMGFPSPFSEYSSPQFSPVFSEPQSPWVGSGGDITPEDRPAATPTSYNQRSTDKMKQDEVLGMQATISAVLYANCNHPEWKTEYPAWPDRYKQILKKWRSLPTEKKTSYLQLARENRSALRIKKTQQDPDKITQHKTVREAEQERQWKQLQAQRQQQAQQTQQVIQDQRVLVSEKLIPAMARVHRQLTADGTSFSHDQHNLTQQLQVSTNQEISLGPLASPSPNSRNQFMGSQGKNRIAPPQSPSFTHPNLPPPSLVQRPNALNLPRQGPNLVRPVAAQKISTPAEHLQRLTQSPFSPQPPQSPHEFPGSMSPAHGGQIDTFSRPPSESGSIENYNQSPHTPRSFGHQSPNPQRSPAYVSQTRVVNEGYVQAPGTPRPQFNSPTPRPQVYLGMRNEYSSQTQPFSSPRPDHFVNQSGQNQPTEINRQLRDLLQRQQAPNQQRLQVLYGQDSQQINPEPVIQTSESQSHGDATFRQPLPPGLVRPRVQGNTGAIIKPPVSVGQLGNMSRPQLQNIQDHGRGRMILQPGPGMVGQNLQRPVVQQYIQNPRMPQRSNASEQFDHLTQQRSVQFPGKNQDAVLLSQRLGRQPEPLQMSPRLTQAAMSVQQQRNAPVSTQQTQQLPIQPPAMTPLQTAASTLSNQPSNISLPSPSPNSSSPSGGLTSEPPEIPDSVTAELDRLEQEGNGMAEVEGVGDILGGLGDDDDALLVSLTAEMGADFNILEYADPELDALSDGEKTNILDSLELDEPDPEQEKPHVKKEPEERDERIKSEQEIMSHEDKHKPEKKIKQEIIAPSISEAHKLSEKQMPPLTVSQTQLSHKNIPVSIGGHMSKGLPIAQPNLQLHSNLNQNPQLNQPNQQTNQNPQLPQQSDNMAQLHQNVNNQQAILQQQIINQPMQQIAPSLQQQQQIQQQMQHQVQQAAAMGRAMIPGTRLMSPDGAVGIVTANNTVTVSYPGLLQQRHLHVHQPRIQMRVGPNGQQQRVVQVGPSSLQHQQMSVPRMGIAPPPPPPYPGPPPPYPGPLQQQMGVRLPPRPVPSPGPGALGAMLGHHNQLPQPLPIPRRPLLLQEQPLLLEELLEQEKREQERQQIPGDTATAQVGNLGNTAGQSAPTALLTDQEFERLRADIVGGAGPLPLSSPPQGIPAQGLLPVQTNPAIRAPLPPRTTTPAPWQPVQVRTPVQKPVPQTPLEPRIPLFAQPVLPPPPLPPEIIQNEQDRQVQVHYEQWLSQQNQIVTQQLKYYDTEVQKLRKIRKSLNSKQRQLRKSGNELTEADATELARISAEQSILQKHLENARKQSRQHGMLIQEYRNKQQTRQAGNSPAPQSPLLSPSPGPLQQQPPASPMHSPGNLLAASHSPGPGSVGSILQSPGNHGNSNSSMSPHHMQPSPRIGTPHSQTDENPFSPTSGPTPSPSSLPTRMVSPARMTSPQHRIVGQPAGLVGNRSAPSPTGYPQTQYQNQRFVRPTLVEGQRPRMNMPPVFLQGARPGFSAAQLPLGSPQPIMSSGVNTAVSQCISQQADALQTQRTMQLVQQRRLMQQQQQLQQQQQQQLLQQQQQQQQSQQQLQQQQPNLQQTQTTIAQQQLHHHQMLAQQQALAKQQMSHMQQQSVNQRSPMNQPPSSPLNPRSPMLQSLSQQIMSQGQTGMTHQQSMSSQNQPQSPMSRGMVHGQYGQPPSSPMLPKSPLINQAGVHGGSPLSGMRRPPSTGGPISSPSSLPDRPHSSENLDPPRTPLTPYQHNPDLTDAVEHAYNMGGGGGNPHNPQNSAPTPPGFGRFGYIKLGLRGGAPVWGTFGKGFKRIPTASGGKDSPTEKSIDQSPGKVKKEAHINKVSILKKKIPKPATITSTPAQAIPISKVTSLVCADYNEFDDSSSTPPISPAPSTSQQHDKKINKNIHVGKKLPEEIVTETEQEVQMQEIVVIDSSPDEKQQILDYDDDNEKLVGAEVSLSSVAQPEDDITVIETFATGDLEEIVSSPLESEVAEEYVLFSSDMVVDYGVDSDDSMKHYVQKTTEEGEYSQQEITELGDKNVEIVNVSLESPNESSDEESNSKNEMHKGLRMDILKNMDHDILLAETPESPFQEDMNIDPSPEHYSPHTYKDEDLIASLGDGSEIVIIDPNVKSPEEHNIATTEDFEELIDCGNKQGSRGSPEDSGDEREEQNQTETLISVSEAAKIVQSVAPEKTIVTTVHKPIVMTRLPIINATVISPRPTKKLVKEVTQTTAMVSIGNTTISVPVLKNVPLTTSAPDKKLNECSVATSVSLSKSTIISVVSSGSRLSMANTISLGKLNLTSTILSASPRMSAPINSTQVLKPKIIEKIAEKPPSSPSIVYSTLSTLNISPDASLPQKIFEDESISPDSSIGNDLEDIEKEEQAESLETKPVEDNVEKKTAIADIEKELTKCENSNIEENVEEVQNVQTMSPEEMLEQILKESEDDKRTKEANDKPSTAVFSPQDNVVGNTITIHNEMGESMEEPLCKTAQQFEDMLTMLETITGDSKFSPVKEINSSAINVKSTDELVTTLSDNSQDSMADLNDIIQKDLNKQLPLQEPSRDKVELPPKPSVIPVHVIIKSRESSQSPVTVASVSRLTSVMPQLSPLSQPSELTSNVANATQQLRTIMSSVSSNNMIKLDLPQKEVQQSTPIARSDSLGLTQVNFENLLPSTKVEVPHKVEQTPRTNLVKSVAEKQMLSQVMATKPSPSTSRSESPVTIVNTGSVIPARITTQTGRLSPVVTSAGNILITGKKQRRSSPAGSPASISGSPKHSPLIGTQSPMNSPKVTTTTINTSPMAMPNLTKIQVPVKSETRPPSILGSTLTQPQQIRQTFSVNQPPALIMTSRTAPPLCVTTASFLPLSQTNFQAVISTAGVGIQPETVTLFQTISQSMANTNVVTVMKPTSTLLHSQLTGPPFRRSKSIDEVPAKTDTVGHIQAIKRHSVEMITTVKSEPMDTSDESLSSQIAAAKLDLGNTKFTSLSMTPKAEDSQNVLLKQLLQNSGTTSATSLTSSILPRSTVQSLSTHQRAPSLGLVSSLEAQLARPVIPPPTPPTNITHVEVPKSSPVRILSRETSFVSRPLQTVAQAIPQTCQPTQVTQPQGLIDVRRTATPLVRTPIKEELISPTSKPAPLTNPTPPPIATMQKEIALPQQSPVQPMLLSHEVKKELIDDSSQQSAISGISDQGKLEMTIKDEFPEASNESTENKLTDKSSECRKRKRREYQQNRRKNQSQNKLEAVVTTATKKKPRKASKMEQDYDIFIDNLMVQLRGLQQLPIIEPPLCRNFGVCPLFGSGDLAKIGVTKDYNTRKGDLEGNYGSAVITNVADFYNTKPFGDKNPLPEQPAASTQRGFYDQEFSPIKFEHDIDDRKLDLFSRDIDTPDTVYSTSSPECVMYERPARYPGLRLIEEGNESEEEMFGKRASPIIPLIAPVPIRLKPGTSWTPLDKEKDKENIGFSDSTTMGVKSRFGPPIPLKESSNVTVTLTLTSAAAEDIFGVLKDLANILHIPPPTGYQIVERTTTPPSQKLGLYRTKGKDGKEGAPIDIQTILNGAAKFCRHCDVVILNSLIRAKVSEFPLLPRNNELINDTDDLYFCSKSCYKQFQWCPSSILDEKVIKKSPEEGKILITDSSEHEKDESMDIDENDIVIKQEIKEEDMDTFVMEENKNTDNKLNELSVLIPKEDISSKPNKKVRKVDESLQSSTSEPPSKVWKGETYKFWKYGCIQPAQKYKKPTEKDITAMIFKVGITVMPPKIPDDIRKCIFCHQIGDSAADGPARLLNFDVDKWVHLNCALWSEGVYETVNGALMNLELALQLSLSSNCVLCSKSGATIKCFKTRCTNIYHLNCACKDSCVFYKNKTTFCNSHIPKGEKDNELTTLSVQRRVYINRDENRQVASVMHHSDLSNLLRVGSLIFLNVGQLLPHQLQAFHTPNYIYPVGYKIVRFYWSMRQPNKRCRYICSIADVAGRPEFRVLVQEATQDDIELRDISPRAVWTRILDPLANMRKENNCVSLFPKFVTGEDLFGLTEPAVVRVLESLPGIETLTDYRFKYGRNPLLELPLAINPTGAARSEPKLKSSMIYKKPHTQRTASSSNSRSAPVPGSSMAGEAACPYSKQFVHSKSSQYKKMKQDWRNNVYLARSKIQGLGLYAARDIEKHTMVIEYIGEVIRHELSELREKQYEARNRGIYMFRLDEERVVDATLSGGLARYINHSCNPNCVAEIIEVDREVRIIIFAKRRINRGEELSYDYKFDIEDDAHKISCMCGAPNCKKWMN